ncbi:MAG: sigma-70 family RNA polymerase sigma factor [Tannerella sp.]|jgi:RNA polymerase sigma-70 factor (ECF subfamily)|nr:sigma-70 family RNA polymerase sigma factor [Tannerella sp.]
MKTTQLLNLIADSRQDAFSRFYDLYYEQVFRFAFYFLKEKEACREVVTNVFFSVWQSRKKLKDITNIETYLYVATRNESRRFQAQQRDADTVVSLDEIPLHIEALQEASAEEQLITAEMETLLTHVINQLPEKCRIIFLMSREEGLKPRQIAEILSIRESTVRVQMKIAVEKIIATLKPHFPDLLFSCLLSLILS